MAHAGVFTTPYVLPYLAHILDKHGMLHRLEGFACRFGRQFYGMDAPKGQPRTVTLVKSEWTVPASFEYFDDEDVKREVVPFLAGKPLAWRIE